MVVCGDNALAQRICKELATVYRQHVTVVLPSLRGGNHGPQIAELVGAPELTVEAVEAGFPDDAALIQAGIERASALAITSGDDQLNIYIALRARRINPQVRLVIRMFNRNLGDYLADLLDRAARLSGARTADAQGSAAVDATTTVLSDSDTAAPSLVAAAVVGSDKVLHADGLLLRAKERTLAPSAAAARCACWRCCPPPKTRRTTRVPATRATRRGARRGRGRTRRGEAGADPAAVAARRAHGGPMPPDGRTRRAAPRPYRRPSVLLPDEDDLAGLPPRRRRRAGSHHPRRRRHRRTCPVGCPGCWPSRSFSPGGCGTPARHDAHRPHPRRRELGDEPRLALHAGVCHAARRLRHQRAQSGGARGRAGASTARRRWWG